MAILLQIATCILSAKNIFHIMEVHSITAIKYRQSPFHHLPFWKSFLRTYLEIPSLFLKRTIYSAWFGLRFGVLILLASLFWVLLNILDFNPDISPKSSWTAAKSQAEEMSWVGGQCPSKERSRDPWWGLNILRRKTLYKNCAVDWEEIIRAY